MASNKPFLRAVTIITIILTILITTIITIIITTVITTIITVILLFLLLLFLLLLLLLLPFFGLDSAGGCTVVRADSGLRTLGGSGGQWESTPEGFLHQKEHVNPT